MQRLLDQLRARAESAETRAEDAESRAESAESRAHDALEQVRGNEKLITALMEQIASLTRRLSATRAKPEQMLLKLELRAIQRRLDELNRDKFGQRSERRGRKPNADANDGTKDSPKKGHGPNPQVGLPRDPQRHLLDDADKICPKCEPAQPLKPWKDRTEDSEEITVVERTFRVTLHQRQIYRCTRCDHLETALGPKRLIPGGRYSPEFAATVAVDKYRDHLPLNRQSRRMAQAGLTVTRQTLWDQIEELYILLLPSYLALQDRILSSELVYADETSWRYMQKGRTKRWWVWGASDGRRVFFLLAPSRGTAAARQLLKDFDGVLMADRYSAYLALERERSRAGGRQVVMIREHGAPIELPTPDYELAACWMHARRGFIRAARHGDELAEVALDLIAGLYRVEAEAKEEAERSKAPDALLAARARRRRDESAGIIADLRRWADDLQLVPGLPLAKAVQWLNNGWTQLTRFLDDPRVPLDNGLAERAVRGVVLGRKTHAGSRSADGTRVAAMFYSFVETCRLEGVDARAYLIEAARRALQDREQVFLPEDYAEWRRTVESGDIETDG